MREQAGDDRLRLSHMWIVFSFGGDWEAEMGTQLRHLQTPQSSVALRRQPSSDDLQEEQRGETAIARSPMGPATITALQRTHGNARVQRLLAPAGGTQIQRDASFDPADYRNDEVIDNAVLGKEKMPLYKLNDDRSGSNWSMRFESNVEARRVIHQFNGLEGVHENWMDAMGVLETHEGKGAAANTKVQKAGTAIGKLAEKQSGQALHDRVKNYVKSVDDAKTELGVLSEKQDEITNSLSQINTVMIGKEKLAQQRVVKQGEEDVKDEEERIEKSKEFVSDALELFAGLADPTEWVKFTVDAAVFIGKQAVDAHFPTSKLDKLKKELETAKKKLSTIEDAEVAARLEEAAGRLTAAKRAYDNQKAKYKRVFTQLRFEQKALISALEQSPATKGAAGAIKERGMVSKTAMTAEKLIHQHNDLSTMLLQQIGTLEENYRTIHSLASQTSGRPAAYTEHFTVVPERNVENLQPLKNWVNNARSAAQDDLAYIAAGDYLSGYEEIPDTLVTAVLDAGES
jgi:hypothetical protein